MGDSKYEPTIGDLLSDSMMVAALQRSRTTSEDVRTMLREAYERVANAKAEAGERTTSHYSAREDIEVGAPCRLSFQRKPTRYRAGSE